MFTNIFRKLIAFLTLLALVLAGYWFIARPYQLNWGATEKEISRSMPGDELDSAPTFLSTRAITIDGRPEAIWPWLLQMGYERAGFYGYDIIENIGSPRGLESANTILPEFQSFIPGDEVPISAVARMVFHAVEPNRYLIWTGQTAEGGFTWALYPLNDHQTRLVSRIRWTHHWSPPGIMALDIFTEFTDHLAVRKILQGVKGRVEGQVEPMAQQNFEVALFVAAFLLFCAGLVNLIARPLTGWTWLIALAAGIGWLVVWYAPIAPWFSGLLQLSVVLAGIVKSRG